MREPLIQTHTHTHTLDKMCIRDRYHYHLIPFLFLLVAQKHNQDKIQITKSVRKSKVVLILITKNRLYNNNYNIFKINNYFFSAFYLGNSLSYPFAVHVHAQCCLDRICDYATFLHSALLKR